MEERRQLKTKDAVIIYAVATIFSLLMSVPLVFAKEGFAKVAINYLIPQVSYAICIFGYIHAGKFKVVDAIPLKKKTSPLLVALSVVIAVALIAQDHILMLAFSLLMEKLGVTLSVALPQMTNWYTAIITIIVIVILPPIFEEFMFRGVFLSSLKPRGMKYAVLVTAAIFALSHLNAAQLVHQFIVGAVLGYIAFKSGNIVYAIVIHMTNNLLALVLQYWNFYNSLSTFSTKNTLIMVSFFIGGAILLFVCLKFFKKECESQDKIEAFEKRDYKKQGVWYNTTTDNNPIESALTAKHATLDSQEKPQELSEDEIIDKALKSLKDNPKKLVDLWILGLCCFLAFLLIFTTITSMNS